MRREAGGASSPSGSSATGPPGERGDDPRRPTTQLSAPVVEHHRPPQRTGGRRRSAKSPSTRTMPGCHNGWARARTAVRCERRRRRHTVERSRTTVARCVSRTDDDNGLGDLGHLVADDGVGPPRCTGDGASACSTSLRGQRAAAGGVARADVNVELVVVEDAEEAARQAAELLAAAARRGGQDALSGGSTRRDAPTTGRRAGGRLESGRPGSGTSAASPRTTTAPTSASCARRSSHGPRCRRPSRRDRTPTRRGGGPLRRRARGSRARPRAQRPRARRPHRLAVPDAPSLAVRDARAFAAEPGSSRGSTR